MVVLAEAQWQIFKRIWYVKFISFSGILLKNELKQDIKCTRMKAVYAAYDSFKRLFTDAFVPRRLKSSVWICTKSAGSFIYVSHLYVFPSYHFSMQLHLSQLTNK